MDTVIDRQAFRSALGSFVTGVTIVTTRDAAGEPVGLTANSFNSVSLDPPMVLWSLALTSGSLPAFREAKTWAVHVLAADQENLSNRFASRGVDKFAGLSWEQGQAGVPLLPGCAARFVCTPAFEYDGGDHAIFVGEVVDLMLAPDRPLVFHGGRYGRVVPPSAKPPAPQDIEEGEFGRYFTAHLLGSAHNAAFATMRQEIRRRGLRSADYTVIASLGLGDGLTLADLRERTTRAGADVPSSALERLLARGDIVWADNRLHLTSAGRRVMIELAAVAQASQIDIEARLSSDEMCLLHDLLQRFLQTEMQ